MPVFMDRVQSTKQNSGDISLNISQNISDSVLAHYRVNARALPWRVPPAQSAHRLPDPYHVWLSEIMLQQTTVAAVIPYFEKFCAIWPSFAALAAADDANVMAAWAGLGYYARARNLLACARQVAREYDGKLPATEADLLKLPGIGPYTAAAITAIAFGRRAIVIDANIERVISRVFAIDTPLPQSKPQIRARLEEITPAEFSGDFAQALMDLGAGICSPRNPDCAVCPIVTACAAYKLGTPDAYPIKQPKKPKPTRQGMAYWIQHNGNVWLVKRPDKGMLGGMRALPDDGWSARANGDAAPPYDADWRILPGYVQHEFTHFTLQMQITVTDTDVNQIQGLDGEYWSVKSLDKAGLPTLFIKAAKMVARHNEANGE
jgi:A/G-specific adenine glycosylase